MRSSCVDTRPACELHTHGLWESYADSNSNADHNPYCYGYVNTYTYGRC